MTPKQDTDGAKNIERWGWYSIAVSVMLALMHGIIAAASGSLAVAAELAHNVVDLLAALAVLAGLKLATRKSEAFPYGLYKVENLAAAGLAGMVFVSAWEIARDALLAPPVPVRVDAWMLALLAATAAIPLAFSHFELRAARAANSPALLADAKEYRVHVFTTGLAFVALLSQWLHYPLDRFAALIIPDYPLGREMMARWVARQFRCLRGVHGYSMDDEQAAKMAANRPPALA